MSTTTLPTGSETSRPCARCKGEGKVPDILREGSLRPCRACEGTGSFAAPDVKALVDELFTKRGKKRSFRKSYTSTPGFKDHTKARAYYVWRLARFHGGADVTMPMTADMMVWGDPFKAELDALSEVVAKLVFGTDMAAAFRWAGALGHNVNVPAGMPASAYPGGPVADSFKPAFEALELI
jgi:hypothetical protein